MTGHPRHPPMTVAALRASVKTPSQGLQIEAQTNAEGVERFLQIDAHAARRRARAARGRAGRRARAAGGQTEGLGVVAEVRPAVLGPPLPAGEELGFPTGADRAADPVSFQMR
jgi:hypothetical protein